MSVSYTYNKRFMEYAAKTSKLSAERIIAEVLAIAKVESVLDVGCAYGIWLKVWAEFGVSDYLGIDGEYVSRSLLLVEQDRFQSVDLSRPMALGRKFDLVQSLEVAEHLPASSARTFVETLVGHSLGLVLFSAAPPGQGGEHHVNEQPYEYWRKLFASFGFQAIDYIRPLIANEPTVSFWYRYNTFLFANGDGLARLPDRIRACVVPADRRLRDISPLAFRIRKLVVRCLPPAATNGLAKLKAQIHSR